LIHIVARNLERLERLQHVLSDALLHRRELAERHERALDADEPRVGIERNLLSERHISRLNLGDELLLPHTVSLDACRQHDQHEDQIDREELHQQRAAHHLHKRRRAIAESSR